MYPSRSFADRLRLPHWCAAAAETQGFSAVWKTQSASGALGLEARAKTQRAMATAGLLMGFDVWHAHMESLDEWDKDW